MVPEIWCAARGLDKEQRRAVSQPYVIAVQIASLASLSVQGVPDASLANTYFLVVPLLVGVGIGISGFQIASSITVTRAAMSVAVASGLTLLLFA